MYKSMMWVTAAAIFGALPTEGWSLEYRDGPLRLRLDLIGSAQVAYFDEENNDGHHTDDVYEWTIRGIAEYVFDNGILVGIRVEYDDDFDVTSDERADEGAERDELYAYVSTPWGRIEVGEQDGPADTLSLHAPVIGLGQVRGDFGRHQGTIALLSPTDTQDAFKVIYLSPPIKGLRGGISYGPKLDRNTNQSNPRRWTVQRDHVEVALQYQNQIGPVALGISGSYVSAESDPITEREDIDSWSVGSEMSWNEWTFGAAFVDRGDSNTRLGRDQTEWNYGVAWRKDDWGLALSGATSSRSDDRDNQLFGLGGYYQFLDRRVTLKADVVHYDEGLGSGFDRNGVVALTEIEFRL